MQLQTKQRRVLAWRSNHVLILSKSGHESEGDACPAVWKYSVLTWVSHTLILEVTVCRKCSVTSSSILYRNPFTLASWPVLALQMYVSWHQAVLYQKQKGIWKQLIRSHQAVLSDQKSSHYNHRDCLDVWIFGTCWGVGQAQGLSDPQIPTRSLDSPH